MCKLLKYGTEILDKHLTNLNVLCETSEKHQDPNINTGELHIILIPGKPKGTPENLRPTALPNTIRNVLSFISLHRIRPWIESYLPSKSGFRPDRRTSDVVWARDWLAAKINAKNVKIKIAGMGMSSAFGTIDRQDSPARNLKDQCRQT